VSDEAPKTADRFERITLRNGERAIRSTVHGESMHPTGPWTEANRLYIEQSRLAKRLRDPGPPVVLYDVGLGAAANASAAVACFRLLGAERRRALELVSFETDLQPLRLALDDEEGFGFLTPVRPALEALQRDGQWEEEGLSWTLLQGDFLNRLPDAPAAAELVYFDPFSPKANPNLWSRSTFQALRARCGSGSGEGPGCELFTYSAATPTRVSLLLAGFFVGSGDSTGTKGETTAAATRVELLRRPLGREWLSRWERSSSRAPHGELFTEAHEQAIREHPQFRS
jgi:tRNA U34 5-methylaminomethyl-2-thiouridine-forming methyltransferase MnmC